MKKQRFFLLILLTCMVITACSDKDLLDSEVKNTCNWEGEPIMMLNGIETKLFYYDASKRPAEIVRFDDGIVYYQNTDDAILKIEYDIEDPILCIVCNFPDEAKKLKVSDQGLDIVLSGNVYESGDSEYKYLELTELKKK